MQRALRGHLLLQSRHRKKHGELFSQSLKHLGQTLKEGFGWTHSPNPLESEDCFCFVSCDSVFWAAIHAVCSGDVAVGAVRVGVEVAEQ